MRFNLKIIALILGLGMSHALEAKEHVIAPSVIPNTVRQMQTAGFWLSRHPNPSAVILTSKEIGAWNKNVQDDLNLTKDIFALTQDFKTESLVHDFEKSIKEFVQKDLYTQNGESNTQKYFNKVRINMNTSGVVLGVAPRYGLVVHYADVRFFPTSEALLESPGDIDFDQVQNSSLDVGQAVAIVHQSADRKWYYVYSALSEGWVQADRIAIGDAKTVKDYVQDQNFVVAIASKGDIFLNDALSNHHDYVRMGVRLPLVKENTEVMNIRVPVFDPENKLRIVDGFVRKQEFNAGYLPYTPRSIITQAFVMINQPYGWGGMYGQQDCSAFLDQVFATVGIILPRDSKDQSLVGQIFTEFKSNQKPEERLKVFEKLSAGMTVLSMKGHIMLYLGNVENKPYAIHAVWAYRERINDKDIPKVLNRVVVSDLTLGEGSLKGSLLKRLIKIISIQ